MDKTLRMSLLFDFYGPLLTNRQQDIFDMYFHEDLSLGEISEQLSISRQAVYDILKRSAATLDEFEKKLELVSKYQREQAILEEIEKNLSAIDNKIRACGLAEIIAELEDLKAKFKQIRAES